MFSSLPISFALGAVFWARNASSAVAAAPSDHVIDLNFEDLSPAVQAHPFLAVAFYSPGCGRCRRLLPSWSQAAQLIEDEDLPIRLARIDLSSRGGMLAWKAFGLSRVPTVKVFVGNNSDEPLPYNGHLDANGIAAHLAMLQRDRRRLLEHQEQFGNPAKARRPQNSSDGGDGMDALGISSTELVESGVALLSLSALQPAGAIRSSRSPSSAVASLVENLRSAVGRQRLSLLLFIPEDSPKARRAIAELQKAASFLAGVRPPTSVIVVDLRPSHDTSDSTGHAKERPKGSAGRKESTNPDKALVKRQLSAEFEVQLENGPELRIFLDGKAWVEAGVFRGLPTSDGIVQHMEWVAVEAGLRPANDKKSTDTQGKRASASAGGTVESATAVVDNCLDVPIDTCIAVLNHGERVPWET